MPIVNGSYVAPTWVNDAPPAIDADELNAISQTAESILLPKITITTEDSYTSMTATNGTDTITLTNSSGTWTGWFTDYGTWVVTAVASEGTGTATVEVDAVKEYVVTLAKPLGLYTWSEISTIAQAGTAGNYWAVGDTKAVALSGTVGTLSLNTTLYVYIIGINHRNTNGVTFQGFKTAQTDGIDVCLIANYGSSYSNGSKRFNMNHWGDSAASPYNTNYGGWKGCNLRYDILGSTDTASSGYGAMLTTDNVGYDASSTTATNPVANTLMAALPASLRSMMKPMTIYTDNVGNSNNTETAVTTSIDYLPLLAEFEILGSRYLANQYEQNYQSQYDYYAAGNSKVKYRHSDTGSTAAWWARSPYYSNAYGFCSVSASGTGQNTDSRYSRGIAPMFLV